MPPVSASNKKVRVINLSASTMTIFTPPDARATLAGEAAKVTPDTGKVIRLDPLAASEPLDEALAKSLVSVYQPTRAEVEDNRALLPVRRLVIEPEPGHEIEEFTAMETKFKTCKGRGRPEDKTSQSEATTQFHEGRTVAVPRLYHSVHQAIEYLQQLGDIMAIRQYLVTDLRPFVQEYGQMLYNYRRNNLERAQRGEAPLRGKAALMSGTGHNPFTKGR